MTAPLLEVRGLDAWYRAAQVLFGVDFTLHPGEAIALMGRNGAGKSTVLKAVMGLLDRKRGEITFRGEKIAGRPPYAIARMGLGYVPEERRIFTDLTVLENLEVGRQARRAGSLDGWTAERLFELFPNLAGARNRSAAQLSGGEQQMLAVARTLMGNPDAILLDEPSEGLAPIVVEAIAQTMLSLRQAGVAVVLAEQNIALAKLMADRVYALEKGAIVFEGAVEELEKSEAGRRAVLEL